MVLRRETSGLKYHLVLPVLEGNPFETFLLWMSMSTLRIIWGSFGASSPCPV
jgi:hypothetical protein